MADIEVTRTVDAPLTTVARYLSPRSIVEAEGTFEVLDVEDAGDDGWVVTATATGPGMTTRLSFRPVEDGYRYEQVGDAGPFESMETHLAMIEEGERTRLRATSTVDLGLPLGRVTDRIAGWKRRGELKRALRRIAEAVE